MDRRCQAKVKFVKQEKTVAAVVIGLAFAGGLSFEGELPESCVVIDESKSAPSNWSVGSSPGAIF